MPITVRLFQEVDKEEWNSYVLNHPQGTVFHLTGWKNVVERTFGHRSYYLIAESAENEKEGRKGSIQGIFPLFSVKSLLFSKSLVSLPFAAYGGILAENEEVADQLLKRAEEITHAEGLDYLELRNRDGKISDLHVKDLYVRFSREIFHDLNENMEAIPRKSRRMVRVGEKEGLTYEFGQKELIPAFYDIFAQSYHRLGSPVFPKSLFENILDEFNEKSNILLIRTSEGGAVAGVLTLYYKDEVLPYYAGSLLEYRDLAPNDFMYWQLVKYGWENGYRSFDFGRSKVDTGSYDFKRHWGFKPEPLPYQYYLNRIKEIPNLSPANPKYRKKIELWQKMPLWATKLIGPHIVKYIP